MGQSRFSKLFVAAMFGTFLVGGGSNQSIAAPIGTACSQPTNSHPVQIDCGTFLATISGAGNAGNDGGGPLWILGNSYTQVAKWEDISGVWQFSNGGGPGWSITGTPGNNGTWTLPVGFNILFVVVKSQTSFSTYGQGGYTGTLGTVDLVTKTGPNSYNGNAVFNGANSGNWATAPTILSTVNSGNDTQGRGISHISFYGLEESNPCTVDQCFPVPEPGPLSLLGIGLLGLGLNRWRKRS